MELCVCCYKCFNYICEELKLTVTEVRDTLTQTLSGRCTVELKTKSCSLGIENLDEKLVFTTESQFIYIYIYVYKSV